MPSTKIKREQSPGLCDNTIVGQGMEDRAKFYQDQTAPARLIEASPRSAKTMVYQASDSDTESETDKAEGEAIRAEMESARLGLAVTSRGDSDNLSVDDQETFDFRDVNAKEIGSKRALRMRRRRRGESSNDKDSDSEFMPSEDEPSDSESEFNETSSPRKFSPSKSKQTSDPKIRARRQKFPSPNERARQGFRIKQTYLPSYITGNDAADKDDEYLSESVVGDDDTEPWLTEPTDYLTEHVSKPSAREVSVQTSRLSTEEPPFPAQHLKFEWIAPGLTESNAGSTDSESEEDALRYFDRHYGSKSSTSTQSGKTSTTGVSPGSARRPGQRNSRDLDRAVGDSNVDWFDNQYSSIKALKKTPVAQHRMELDETPVIKEEIDTQDRATPIRRLKVGGQEIIELSD